MILYIISYLICAVFSYLAISKNWEDGPWTLRKKVNAILVVAIPIINYVIAFFCILYLISKRINWEKEQKW